MNRTYGDPVEYLTWNEVALGSEAGWYFWDETWAYSYGPFETEDIARAELKKYWEQMDLQDLEEVSWEDMDKE